MRTEMFEHEIARENRAEHPAAELRLEQLLVGQFVRAFDARTPAHVDADRAAAASVCR